MMAELPTFGNRPSFMNIGVTFNQNLLDMEAIDALQNIIVNYEKVRRLTGLKESGNWNSWKIRRGIGVISNTSMSDGHWSLGTTIVKFETAMHNTFGHKITPPFEKPWMLKDYMDKTEEFIIYIYENRDSLGLV